MPKLALSIATAVALAIVGVAAGRLRGQDLHLPRRDEPGRRGSEAEGARRRQGRVHRNRDRERLDAHDQLEADLHAA